MRKTIIFVTFILLILLISCKLKPEQELLGISMGNGSLNTSFNLDYDLTFPINISDSQINWSLLDVNFTKFILQNYTDYNISAYGQSNDTPCYVLTNNGTENITVVVKMSSNSSEYAIHLRQGNNNITGKPSVTLTTSFQDFVNLTINETKNVSCFGDYNNAVLNNTFNTSIIWNLTVI